MSKNYFDHYISPNIVIVPTVSFCGVPPTKKSKQDTGQITTVTETMCANQTADLLQGCVTKLQETSNRDLNKAIVQESNKIIKTNSSWASNYLHSIGHSPDSALKKKRYINSNTPVTLKKENIRNNNNNTTLILQKEESLTINTKRKNLYVYQNPERKFVIPKIKNKYEKDFNTHHESKLISINEIENTQINHNYNKSQDTIKTNNSVMNNMAVIKNNIKKECEIKPIIDDLTKNSTTKKICKHEPKYKIQKQKNVDLSIKKEIIEHKSKKTLALKRTCNETEEKNKVKLKYLKKSTKTDVFNQTTNKRNQSDVTQKIDLDANAKPKDKIISKERKKVRADVRNDKITKSSNKYLSESKPEKDSKYSRKDLQKITHPTTNNKIKHDIENKQNKSLKSVVEVAKLRQSNNSPKFSNQSKDFKMKRNQKEDIFKRYKEVLYEKRMKRLSVSQHRNLLVTVDNNNYKKKDISNESVKTKTREKKSRSEKRKNINIVINIFYKSSKENDSENTEVKQNSQPVNDEFSFLDDIDVDEIVESLNTCENERKVFIESALPHMKKNIKVKKDESEVIKDQREIKVNESNQIITDIAEDKKYILSEGLTSTGEITSENLTYDDTLTFDKISKRNKQDTTYMKIDENCKNITNEKIIAHELLKNAACTDIVLKKESMIIDLSDEFSQDFENTQESNYTPHKHNEEINKRGVILKDKKETSIDIIDLTAEEVKDQLKPLDMQSQQVEDMSTRKLIPEKETIIIESKTGNQSIYEQIKNNNNNKQETKCIKITLLSVNCENITNDKTISHETLKNINAPYTDVISKKESVIIDLSAKNSQDIVSTKESNYTQHKHNEEITKGEVILKDIKATSTEIKDLSTEAKDQLKPLDMQYEQVKDKTTRNFNLEKETIIVDSKTGNQSKCEQINTNNNINKLSNKLDEIEIPKNKLIFKNKNTTSINISNKDCDMEIKQVNSDTDLNKKCAKKKSKALNKFPYSSIKFFIKNVEKRMLEHFRLPYTLTSIIRNGKHSRIFNCKSTFGINFAVKSLKKRISRVLKMHEAILNMQRNIPKIHLCTVYFLNMFVLDSCHWCILMEYYPKTLNDALYKHKATFHITTVQILGRQLISAVLMLRNNSIVHLDIKPSHILLNHANNNLKLCGFDKSSFHDCIIYSPTMMMPKYRAPEIILGYQISYGVDVWASALMLYEMATKRTLFPGNKNNDILYKQMCTFGNIPRDMIEQSAFKDKHFKQGIFVKDPLYPNKMSNTITTFIKNGRLERSIFEAYNYNWGKSADMQKVQKDIALLTAFHKLLEKMLELHPLNRIPIEFVYANPFIYETYDF